MSFKIILECQKTAKLFFCFSVKGNASDAVKKINYLYLPINDEGLLYDPVTFKHIVFLIL